MKIKIFIILSVLCLIIGGCTIQPIEQEASLQSGDIISTREIGKEIKTTQDIGNEKIAVIKRNQYNSNTTLTYSGVKSSSYRQPPRPYATIFSGFSGHSFYYKEEEIEFLSIMIYQTNLGSLPPMIFSGLCELYDRSEEETIISGKYFGYRPTKKYINDLNSYKDKDSLTVLPRFTEVMEKNRLNTMYPCGFPNSFQVIGDYIIAGGFGWKDGGGARGGWMQSIEIIEK